MAIVVELLARNGKPIKHFYFDKNTVKLGRGYHNDLTLEDPYVCAEHLHASLDTESGKVSIEDINSLNGTKVNDQLLPKGEIDQRDEITLGRTRLRIFDANTLVPRAIPLSALEENIGWMNTFFWAVSLTVGFACVLLLGQFLTTYDEFKLSQSLPKIMGQMALFSAWPLTLALLAKLAKKESRILSLFSLLWLFLLTMQLLSNVERGFEFNFNHASWVFWAGVLMLTICTFIFVWFSLFVAFHQSKQRRNLVSSIATGLLIVPAITFQLLSKPDFSAKPAYGASLLPMTFYFMQPADTPAFLQKSDDLFNQVDAAILKQNQKEKQ